MKKFTTLNKEHVIIKLLSILLLFIFIFTLLLLILPTPSRSLTGTINIKEEYYIFVEIDENKLYLYQDNRCIKSYPIATGKPEWPSPIGTWKIVNKDNWGQSFGGKWMGLDVPWGKYGIHGTSNESSIGSAASHGCIRMYNEDIKELYDLVPEGTTVVVREGSFGPFGKGFRNLYPGDRGADVLAVQKRLYELGFFNGWESGIYEDNLKKAVHSFQKENGLKVKNAITRDDYHAMGFKEFE